MWLNCKGLLTSRSNTSGELRINGVEVEPGKEETGNDCLNKCKKIFKDLGVRIPETALDRAHGIGREKEVTGKSLSANHRALHDVETSHNGVQGEESIKRSKNSTRSHKTKIKCYWENE